MFFLPFIDDDLVYERPEQFGSQFCNIGVFLRDIKEPLYVRAFGFQSLDLRFKNGDLFIQRLLFVFVIGGKHSELFVADTSENVVFVQSLEQCFLFGDFVLYYTQFFNRRFTECRSDTVSIRCWQDIIRQFETKLTEEEKSDATKEKYLRDIRVFAEYCGENELTKEAVIAYKQKLLDDGYAVRSVNSVIASLNSFFSFLGRHDLRVKSLKIQQQFFCPEEKELTKAEYERLCRAAEKKKNDRLDLIIQTICGTGIRVSELQFITVEAVRRGEATVSLKGKIRTVFIVKSLQKKLRVIKVEA